MRESRKTSLSIDSPNRMANRMMGMKDSTGPTTYQCLLNRQSNRRRRSRSGRSSVIGWNRRSERVSDGTRARLTIPLPERDRAVPQEEPSPVSAAAFSLWSLRLQVRRSPDVLAELGLVERLRDGMPKCSTAPPNDEARRNGVGRQRVRDFLRACAVLDPRFGRAQEGPDLAHVFSRAGG
jgi:hypothetical protein